MTQSAFAPIFPGWNVWQVWQVKDLPFAISMIGVDPERQLRIWVEDNLRLHSSADVADSLDLKGSGIEIIPAAPGLATAMRKEQVPGGASFLVSGPATLFTLRFFNKGGETQLAWPHDDSYLLDSVFEPAAGNPATTGPAPTTIAQTVGHGVTQPLTDVLGSIPWWLWAGAIGAGVFLLIEESGKVRRLGKRIRNS